MFYMLCIALCLGVTFLVCVATGLVSVATIALGGKALRRTAPQTRANTLFLLRLAPLFFAIIVSLGLALPAFFKFEPARTEEIISRPLLALAVLGAAVLAAIAFRLIRMQYATRRLERRWIERSQSLAFTGSPLPVYLVSGAESLLAVTGVFRAQVFVSRDVAQALTQEELLAALQHELAHVRRFDNLRQLLLRSMRLPLRVLREADADWTGASEIAADEAAVEAGTSAMELSSALVKVGRLRGKFVAQTRLAASHLAPAGCGASTGARAAHLRALLEKGCLPARSGGVCGKILAALALVAAYVACLGTLLPAVHEFLELLVR